MDYSSGGTAPVSTRKAFQGLPWTELTNQSFLLLVAFLNIPLSLELVVQNKQEQSQKASCLLQDGNHLHAAFSSIP